MLDQYEQVGTDNGTHAWPTQYDIYKKPNGALIAVRTSNNWQSITTVEEAERKTKGYIRWKKNN